MFIPTFVPAEISEGFLGMFGGRDGKDGEERRESMPVSGGDGSGNEGIAGNEHKGTGKGDLEEGKIGKSRGKIGKKSGGNKGEKREK